MLLFSLFLFFEKQEILRPKAILMSIKMEIYMPVSREDWQHHGEAIYPCDAMQHSVLLPTLDATFARRLMHWVEKSFNLMQHCTMCSIATAICVCACSVQRTTPLCDFGTLGMMLHWNFFLL